MPFFALVAAVERVDGTIPGKVRLKASRWLDDIEVFAEWEG